MHKNVEHLLTRINEENFDQDFQQDLMIFGEEEKKDVEKSIESNEYQLFKDIHSTRLSIKKKGSRFSMKQALEVKMQINKHKGNHVKIRKALKISSSRFNRLWRENDEEYLSHDSKILKGNIKTPLDLDKKKYIERLVHPPTVPFIMKGIKEIS